MNIIHRSKLRHIEFTLATGEIFEANVDAIVSSEQTDFVLSGNNQSLSGQIRKRYGDPLQRELDAVTKGQVLGPGTVIETSGGATFKRIFHAGFHDPNDGPDLPAGSSGGTRVADGAREFRETDYFAAIGSCTQQILNIAAARKLNSVAFPLIGCGLFGLDEKMLILQFLDAIEEFDQGLDESENLHVWLVIRDRAQFESTAGVFLDLLMQARRKMFSVRVKSVGVPILDRFANRLLERANEDWAKWLLCRYAEVAVEIMCCGLCRAIRPFNTPESVFEENRAPTFGVFLNKAKHLADPLKLDDNAWGARFFGHVLQDVRSLRALDELNYQRNNLAHGRQSLPLPAIRKLVLQALQLDSWERIPQTDGELRLADWRPWLQESETGGGHIGLFERWQKDCVRYLVPETGEIFKEPRNNLLPEN
jgi:O-acetyl-ADP-ribose deacetylase (regulator of RNase III)